MYSFHGTPDGGDPKAALVMSKSGSLYGTTEGGGASGLGTIFEMTKPTGEPWKENVLFSFNGSDGQYPWSPLVFGSTGALYGATPAGGCGGCTGLAYELAPPSAAGGTWTGTVLYEFSGSLENAAPSGPLVLGPGGTIYITTGGGGAPALGQVNALVPPAAPGGAWTESVLYSFGGPPAGEQPFNGLVSEGGSLFGTTIYGGDEFCGAGGCGTVFELTPPTTLGAAWTEANIHTFDGPPTDGAQPEAPLAVGPGGVLYGTTYYGGPNACPNPFDGPSFGCGTVFQLTPPASPGGTWGYSVIYNFTGADGDGAIPLAGVVVGKSGAVYGTTSAGGSAASTSACPAAYYVFGGCGIVFELTPPASSGGAWTETILHSFSGADGDGAIPEAGLVLSPTGILYGTTSAGGTAGRGTVFAVEP
jgi:uncharacterized repeat protein (TIGR03803 family)